MLPTETDWIAYEAAFRKNATAKAAFLKLDERVLLMTTEEVQTEARVLQELHGDMMEKAKRIGRQV